MLTLEAKQQKTRRMLSSLVRAPTEAPDAALGRAWLALLEQLSELGALQVWREATGLAALQRVLPGIIDSAHALGEAIIEAPDAALHRRQRGGARHAGGPARAGNPGGVE